MKDVFGVIVRPLLSEKNETFREALNQYGFEVRLEANKIEIKRAVEQLFGVKVLSVRTLIQRGKSKRFGRYQGQRSNWKKAYVTLEKDQSLDLLSGLA